jgi:hypothetical protein
MRMIKYYWKAHCFKLLQIRHRYIHCIIVDWKAITSGVLRIAKISALRICRETTIYFFVFAFQESQKMIE